MGKMIKSLKFQLNQIPWYKIFESKENKSIDTILMMEKQFFERTKLANGTYKHTDLNRLNDLNDLVFRSIKFKPGKKISISDVAISSGITTMEWCNYLDSKQLNFKMVGSDLYIDGFVIYFFSKKFICVITDTDLNLLEFNIGRIVFSNSISYSPLNWIPYLIAKLVLSLLRIFFLRKLNREHRKSYVIAKIEKIKLISQLLKYDNRIVIKQEDIIEKNDSYCSFDIIRAANILNRAYFDDFKLNKMVAALAKKLNPGGYLIVCRTNRKGQNNGSIFKLQKDNRFTEIAILGCGSEIKNIILAKSNEK